MKINIGCGNRYLTGWENLDFRPVSPDVKPWDLRKRLPYSDSSVDLVYSSHLLEHLSPEQAEALLKDSLRVLKPGGVVRVVVPDLEVLARGYLEAVEGMREAQTVDSWNKTTDRRLQTADLWGKSEIRNQRSEIETAGYRPAAINQEPRTKNQEPALAERYDWSVIFLIDQLVRTRCGGAMLARLAEYKGALPEFLRKRFPEEWLECVLGKAESRKQKTEKQTTPCGGLARLRNGLRWRWRALMERGLGWIARHWPSVDDFFERQRIARFLASGERHQWMYDEVSLGRLMGQVGLIDVRKRTCGTAARFEDEIRLLDMTQAGEAYQPDSLYMEGTARCVCSVVEA